MKVNNKVDYVPLQKKRYILLNILLCTLLHVHKFTSKANQYCTTTKHTKKLQTCSSPQKTTTTFSPKIKLSNYHPLFATWLDSFNKTLLKLFFL